MFRTSILAWPVVLLGAICVTLMMASHLAAQDGVSLAINEIVASNGSASADPQGEYEDWIEIYNYGDAPVDLGGMYLTDDLDAPTKWQVPAGDSTLTTVAAQGYLVVWADGDTEAEGLHAGFKLDADGEDVGLVDVDGVTLIDGTTFPALVTDLSYGRYPDAQDQWQFFPEPTPGAANEGAYDGVVGEIQFSHERGFCDEPFSVTLTTETPETTIYYTLDGEEPGQVLARGFSGRTYREPVEIRRTTCLRAVARRTDWMSSSVATQTYIFVADVVEQSQSGQNPGMDWPAPTPQSGGGGFPGGFFGGGQTMDYGMDPDVVNDSRYKDLMDDALLSIPSVSLVTDLDHLFDTGRGIYVNALQDGRDWERPVSVELIDPAGAEGFQINAGLRIRGGYGRSGSNPKHAFRLFFRSEYGASRLKFPLFGDEGVDTFEKMDLRTAQNYSWSFKGDGGDDNGGKNTMLRDVFSRDVQGAMGQPYTRSRYYHLYLNGQYWGLYQTQERSEARYAVSYLGGDAEDYDVIKVDAGPGRPYVMEATDGSLEAYHRLWEAARNGLGTDAAYYRVQGRHADGTLNPDYERLVDVDSVIDYMLCTYYVGDIDAPISNFLGNSRPNNFYAVYNRRTSDGFKFFRHDAEHTLFDVRENRTGPYSAGRQVEYFNPQWLHQQLVAHPEYRMRFADRAYEHFCNDGVLTPETAAGFLQSRKDTIDLAIIAESARWGDAKVTRPRTKDDDWLPEVEYLLNDYLPYRTDIVLDQFRAKTWYPDVDAPVFNQHGGAADRGFNLLMESPAGDIYYTLDGSDPRLPGGAINTLHAIEYTGPVALTASTQVRARALDAGTWSPAHEAVFAVGPVAESLRISEIMYHPSDMDGTDDPGTEYIELTNVGTETIDLKLVRFADGLDFIFPSFELVPGGYCLAVGDIAAFEAKYGPGLPVAGRYSGQLANGGEKIEVVDALGATIQRFAYKDGWYDATDGGGFSLTIIDPADSDLQAWSQKEAWLPSSVMDGTPGVDDEDIFLNP
jgi:CotH kinase protein/Lamin Tail Domain/Fn3 associated